MDILFILISAATQSCQALLAPARIGSASVNAACHGRYAHSGSPVLPDLLRPLVEEGGSE